MGQGVHSAHCSPNHAQRTRSATPSYMHKHKTQAPCFCSHTFINNSTSQIRVEMNSKTDPATRYFSVALNLPPFMSVKLQHFLRNILPVPEDELRRMLDAAGYDRDLANATVNTTAAPISSQPDDHIISITFDSHDPSMSWQINSKEADVIASCLLGPKTSWETLSQLKRAGKSGTWTTDVPLVSWTSTSGHVPAALRDVLKAPPEFAPMRVDLVPSVTSTKIPPLEPISISTFIPTSTRDKFSSFMISP